MASSKEVKMGKKLEQMNCEKHKQQEELKVLSRELAEVHRKKTELKNHLPIVMKDKRQLEVFLMEEKTGGKKNLINLFNLLILINLECLWSRDHVTQCFATFRLLKLIFMGWS